jgi:hypothetical protein
MSFDLKRDLFYVSRQRENYKRRYTRRLAKAVAVRTERLARSDPHWRSLQALSPRGLGALRLSTRKCGSIVRQDRARAVSRHTLKLRQNRQPTIQSWMRSPRERASSFWRDI